MDRYIGFKVEFITFSLGYSKDIPWDLITQDIPTFRVDWIGPAFGFEHWEVNPI